MYSGQVNYYEFFVLTILFDSIVMTDFLLFLHSWTRWIILILGLIVIIQGYSGWKGNKLFLKGHNTRSAIFVGFFHLQVLMGLIIYFALSPVVQTAFEDFGVAMKNSDLRFWAVEHGFIMIVAAVVAQIGRIKIKKAASDVLKHKATFVYFLIALILVLSRIPWNETTRLFRGL